MAYTENKSELGTVVSAAEFSSESPIVLILGMYMQQNIFTKIHQCISEQSFVFIIELHTNVRIENEIRISNGNIDKLYIHIQVVSEL